MIARRLPLLLAVVLAACSHGEVITPMASYDLGSVAVRPDAYGWYTFGDMRFKGELVNGAPSGNGLCVMKGERQASECSFENGKRTDLAYVEAKREELKRRMSEQLAEERVEKAQRDAAEDQRIRENNARVEANDRAMRAGLAQFNQNLAAAETQDRAIAAETQRLVNEGMRQKQAEADAAAERRRAAQAEKQAQERAQARAAQERADLAVKERADQQRREQEARQREEAERKAKQAQLAQAEQARERERKAAQEKADRARKEKEAKDAELAARASYLRKMETGIKLMARTCPDGEGKYYIVGKRPVIKPEVVSCIDVHYEAICDGSASGSTGVASNFIGIGTDCFTGDTATVSPTPACKVKQVHVAVRAVKACGT